jgi:hypothetical protein
MTGGRRIQGMRCAPILATAIALGAGIGTGWFLAVRTRPVPEPRRVLVDTTLRLRSEGAFFPFTLDGPAAVTVEVHLPEMLEAEVALGPLYAAMRPELVYEPDAEEDVRFPVRGCSTPPFSHRLEKAGPYAVRVPPIPTAMGMESEMFVSVRVTATR